MYIMSFNCVLVAVPGSALSDLVVLGVGMGEATTLDDATLPDAPAPAAFEVEGGTIIASSDIEGVFDWLPVLTATGRKTVVATFGSTADAYSFEVYDHASLVRQWVTVAGETVAEEGEPLLEEASCEYLDEDSLLELVEACTHSSVAFNLVGNYVNLTL